MQHPHRKSHHRIRIIPALTGTAAAALTAATFAGTTPAGAATITTAAATRPAAVARAAQPAWWHERHLAHMARLGDGSAGQAPAAGTGSYGHPNFCGDGDGDGWDVPCQHGGTAAPATRTAAVQAPSSGTYSYAGLEQLWMSAGGPAWAAPRAASIALCESGGRTSAYNPSGATGVWQILGSVVPGNLNNPYVNALNAVAKFRASGNTFAQWVCK